MKKNLLFVIPSLIAAGGEKSLLNLLSQLDYQNYDVDLYLLNKSGMLMEFIPEKVNILSHSETYYLFSLPLFKSLSNFLLKRNVKLIYNRVMFSIRNRKVRNISKREQLNWKYMSNSFEQLHKQYDVAIGFLEKTSIYFCVDKVNALKKIGWIHNDYDKLGMDPTFDINYFQKLDHIITVSDGFLNTLINRFPSQKNKVNIIYNIVSPNAIFEMANQVQSDLYNRIGKEFVILSIGRLHYQKGFELAIEACKKLVNRGYNIQWNIIGEGEERKNLTNLIKMHNLENNFRLLGLKSNPYPYIKQADLYVQPSRFEGKSIAVDEAKILNKPIIVTNFSTANDQIDNGENGLIVEMNSDALAEGIEELILSPFLKEKFTLNLSKLKLGTEEEINKIYKIF